MNRPTFIAPLKASLAEFDIFDDAALNKLVSLALCVDTWLMRATLDFLAAADANPDGRNRALESADAIEVAFRDVLDERGFPPDVMAQEGPQRHPSVEVILLAAAGRAVPEEVAQRKQDMREFLDA